MAYTVGQVAKIVGIHIDTIRFYENKMLLPTPKRAPNGYRIYENDTVEQLQFILNAKSLGFTLKEIEELLQLNHQENMSCCDVLHLTGKKIQLIKQRVDKLQNMQSALESLYKECKEKGSINHCPIIKALIQSKDNDES